MKCKDCGAELKPLFASFFCPNDCDIEAGQERIKAERAAKAKADYEAAAKKLADSTVGFYGKWPFGYNLPVVNWAIVPVII